MHTQRLTHWATGLFWGTLGVAAESGAADALASDAPLCALGLHAAAALTLGLFAGGPRRRSLFVAAAIVFTLPLLGALGLLWVIVPAWRLRRPIEHDDVIELAMPELDRHAVAPTIATAPIELVLRSGGAPKKRVASVMALRTMDAQQAVPLLRVALSDPHEDVRLLAYAILERREKDLRRRIERARAALAAAPPTAAEASALRALVNAHWELARGGFVSGAIETHTLDAAVSYGHRALLATPDGSLALLLARIRLRQNKAVLALRYLRAAKTLGVARAVLAPLYAEVAFLLRRFDVVGALLAEAGEAPLARPRLASVAEFWNERSET